MTEQNTEIVIFGAGKIARGYIGHLLFLSKQSICFVDINPQLVQLLNERGCYTVHILGAPEKSGQVTGIRALLHTDPAVAKTLANAELAFIAVGGLNLAAVAGAIAPGLQARHAAGGAPLNMIVCENWYRPADQLRSELERILDESARAYLGKCIGIAETTVLRSCIEPTPAQRAADPLAVQAQDYWQLQIDADSLIEPLPPIAGLVPITGFRGALERKLYTYNASNATISYLGMLCGHRMLSEAANDPRIIEIVQGVYQETGAALCAQHGYTEDDQRAFAAGALRKFQDAMIADPLVRQVRDPIRKLGRHDRLVGAACLALEHGIEPYHLALGIAAALAYADPSDPAAIELARMQREQGLDYVFEHICGIDPQGRLAQLVRQRIPDLERFR